MYGKDRSTFIDKANELLEAIRTERDNVETRPILLLGHSMGGLLIKQALINAHNNLKYTLIKDATTRLAFFATPHHGGDSMLVSLGRHYPLTLLSSLSQLSRRFYNQWNVNISRIPPPRVSFKSSVDPSLEIAFHNSLRLTL